jgi:hypothetical protein
MCGRLWLVGGGAVELRAAKVDGQGVIGGTAVGPPTAGEPRRLLAWERVRVRVRVRVRARVRPRVRPRVRVRVGARGRARVKVEVRVTLELVEAAAEQGDGGAAVLVAARHRRHVRDVVRLRVVLVRELRSNEVDTCGLGLGLRLG